MQTTTKQMLQGRLTRRGLLRGALGATALMGFGVPRVAWAQKNQPKTRRVVTKGRIKQSVCPWCFEPMPLKTLAEQAAAMGILSVELVPPKDWPILKRHGLICALSSSHGFVEGWNHRENWPMCQEKLTQAIEATAAAGFPSVITFSGFRKGMPDDVGLDNTVAGLKTVIGLAEKNKVNLCIEVLNSRVDVQMKGHPDYMCDKVEWAVEVCRRIGSPRMKILFDIYHVQIMQGDLITRIRQFHEYIGHYHTAGVPGRNEIDDSQEINYPAVMREIVKTGYTGYVGQEFIPTRDPIQSLREAVRLCDV
ncbi:MAG: TIM barrel protein [Thermoguttaceae bacterium]